MRILYVGSRFEYGDQSLGLSFEEMNFRSALEGMGHDVVAFDFFARDKSLGREAMNDDLTRLVAEDSFDLVFFFLHEDEIGPRTIERIGAMGVPTLNWFADDHWRFESFSRRYAPVLTWSVTTDHEALPKYQAAGLDRVILSQWACNRYAYMKTARALDYDVTFVGQPHGNRREVAARIRDAGFDLRCWGNGWESGRLGHQDMVRVFGASRINLNLANSSTVKATPRMRVGAWVRGRRVDTRPRPSQIKGRTFEVPGSGGFLLTDKVAHLEEYFDLGREIAVFSSTDDLIDVIGQWLADPERRAAVAEAGYRRVLDEHTYDHRFAQIFREMGLA